VGPSGGTGTGQLQDTVPGIRLGMMLGTINELGELEIPQPRSRCCIHRARTRARDRDGFYRRQLPPGSLLVISHGCDELDDPEIQEVVRNYVQTTRAAHLRTRDQITAFFGDLELVRPGLVWTPEWGETTQDQWSGAPARSRYLAGVASKPG
jgi:hypothetical protein